MVAAETIWSNPESRSLAETTDAAVKMASIGVPRPALWEFIGATPQQIEEWIASGADILTAGPVAVRETITPTPEQAGLPATAQGDAAASSEDEVNVSG